MIHYYCHYSVTAMTHLYRGPSSGHLAAKGCPVFVVEFNDYNIIGDESISAEDCLVVIWQP